MASTTISLDQHRLAITVFDEPVSLSRTLRTLIGEGFQRAQFCLVALKDIMPQAITASALDGLFTDGGPRLRLVDGWRLFGERQPIVATSSEILDAMVDDGPASPLAAVAADEASACASRLPGAHRRELAGQVLRGGIVLIVTSPTPSQHRQCARILLGASNHSVKTYEFQARAMPHVDAGT